ncbi:HNH endonuclease [Nocardia sp. MH4]|uniref:HNH endonuclease n=1 Tax=Nocardia sp. MH4 TaxID=1768677 RepID=UPI001C4E484E|nr:HNH endonuclease signature motif containing protein [Nocardia sp. MH4]
MPSRPPRVCNRCRRPAPAGQRCPCTPAWSGGAWSGGSTRRWRTLREAKLKDEPICEARGCHRLAVEVDHITPLSAGGARYDWANLQALCEPCHAAKTSADAASGRRRTAPQG